MQTDTRIARFFSLYARQTAENDLPAVVSHFADPFLFAGRSGTQVVRVSDFALALPKRRALFDRLGARPTELISVDDTPLDSQYVLARTKWRFSFVCDNAPDRRFDIDSSFLIDTGQPGSDEAEFKILVYLSHQDVVELLSELGGTHAGQMNEGSGSN